MEKYYQNSSVDIIGMNVEEFLNWYFHDPRLGGIIMNGYVKVDKEFKGRKKVGKLLSFGKDEYVHCDVFRDDECNLKMITFTIGDCVKHYKNFEDIQLTNIIQDGELISLSGFFNLHKKSITISDQLLPTTDSWCGNYIKGGKNWVRCLVRKMASNFKLYSICLCGNDDMSYSKNYYSKESLYKDFNMLLKLKSVNTDSLKDCYFSN